MVRSLVFLLAVMGLASAVSAADEIQIGTYRLDAPDGWTRVQPRSSIIAYEFQIKATKGDDQTGRMTIMAAGGSIEANIERWFGQWQQPDGKATKDRAKVTEKDIAGQTVHLVDLSGTYQDRRGPRSGAGTSREKYRMLAAILETREANYFLKFYGPEKTVSANEEAFEKMVDGLKKQ